MDPATGAVKAMVSGEDYGDSQTNIATSPDGRQTGSTFKVITLAAALENGYSPNDIVDGSSPCAVAGFDGFTQNDEEGGGLIPLWEATAGSVNCAFVRLATSVGEAQGDRHGPQDGHRQDQPRAVPHAHARGVRAEHRDHGRRDGDHRQWRVHHSPYVVQKIVSSDGRTLLDVANPGERVLDADVAACEQNILRHVVVGPENHTGANADVPGHDVFGKTGTTDERNDAWFIGATPQLATAVWFGNWRTTQSGVSAGFGGDSAAPIFAAFMEPALADLPDIPLPSAGPVCARARQSVIDTGGRAVVPAAPIPPLPTVLAPAAPAPPAAPNPNGT